MNELEDNNEIKGKRSRGRPRQKKDTASMFCMRMTDEDRAMLEHLNIEMEENKTDIMRNALRIYYNLKIR